MCSLFSPFLCSSRTHGHFTKLAVPAVLWFIRRWHRVDRYLGLLDDRLGVLDRKWIDPI